MKKQIIIITIITCLMLSLSCKPTPESNIVVSKNSQKKDDALQVEKFPSKWNSSHEKYNNRLIIDIDANVISDNSNPMSIMEIEPYYIPISQVNNIIQYFFGDSDVYINPTQPNKDYLESTILDIERDLAKARSDKDFDSCEELEGVLESVKNEYKNAPTKIDLIKYENEFLVEENGAFNRHHIAVIDYTDDRPTPMVEVYNILPSKLNNGFHSFAAYKNGLKEKYAYFDKSLLTQNWSENYLFQTSKAKKAIEVSYNFLNEVGIDDRSIVRIGPFISSENKNEIDIFKFYYEKEINGSVLPLYIQFGGQTNEAYSDPYNSEKLTVTVKDDKVVAFEWTNAYEIKSILYENVELLDFETLMANIENQLSAKYSYLSEGTNQFHIFIDKIILSYAVEPIKDEPNKYMLVPAWGFYGGEDFGDEVITLYDGNEISGKVRKPYSLLTINALDGSVIFGQ